MGGGYIFIYQSNFLGQMWHGRDVNECELIVKLVALCHLNVHADAFIYYTYIYMNAYFIHL